MANRPQPKLSFTGHVVDRMLMNYFFAPLLERLTYLTNRSNFFFAYVAYGVGLPIIIYGEITALGINSLLIDILIAWTFYTVFNGTIKLQRFVEQNPTFSVMPPGLSYFVFLRNLYLVIMVVEWVAIIEGYKFGISLEVGVFFTVAGLFFATHINPPQKTFWQRLKELVPSKLVFAPTTA